MKKTYHGSCHCGAIRFEADLDLAKGTTRCNCSFCRKARSWFAFAVGSDFRLLSGEDALTDYRHTPPKLSEPFLHLTFCRHCGIRAFARGGYLPQFGDAFHAVNVMCLDDATHEELASAPIHWADGANDDWEHTSPHRYF